MKRLRPWQASAGTGRIGVLKKPVKQVKVHTACTPFFVYSRCTIVDYIIHRQFPVSEREIGRETSLETENICSLSSYVVKHCKACLM